MYKVYMDKTLLPVAPQQITLKVKNQNKAISLINDGEVNILKQAGLSEISFTALLPNAQYPFAAYKGGYRPARYFLDALEKIKTKKGRNGKPAPFQFVVTRSSPDGKPLFGTDMKVSLEDYKIAESAKQGYDISVDISLKQYRDYGTKTLEINDGTAKVTETRPGGGPEIPEKYIVQPGDTLWALAQKYLGSGDRYPEIYAINQAMIDKGNEGGINDRYTLHPGQVVVFA